jgi:peptide/nickel transport system substrate-binding protein
MRRFRSACLAAASALIWTCIADAARPRYGGTLRVQTSAAMRSLNPAAVPLDSADAMARRWLHPLVFETLVAPNASGGLEPVLASHWESDAAATRWRFRLRSGVRLHDGSPLDAGRVAAALRAHGRAWTIATDSSIVTIDVDRSDPDLPWRLANVRYAIAFGRPGGGEPIGTGPFAIDRWEAKRLRLRAHDDHWGGRPFVDTVHIEMGRALADQVASLELGRADLVSFEAHAVRPSLQRGMRITATRPIELVALVFERHAASPAWLPLRRALSGAIDRRSMCSVLLQGYAQPAWALLPDWLGGYTSLLQSDHDRGRARAAVAALPPAHRALTLRVPSSDGLLRAIAERLAVDAREAGLSMTVTPAGVATTTPPDARLVRIRLEPTTRELALEAATLALTRDAPSSPNDPSLVPGVSLEAVLHFERTILASRGIVPLVHLPELYGSAPTVESWLQPVVQPTGKWSLDNVWLRADRP